MQCLHFDDLQVHIHLRGMQRSMIKTWEKSHPATGCCSRSFVNTLPSWRNVESLKNLVVWPVYDGPPHPTKCTPPNAQNLYTAVHLLLKREVNSTQTRGDLMKSTKDNHLSHKSSVIASLQTGRIFLFHARYR